MEILTYEQARRYIKDGDIIFTNRKKGWVVGPTIRFVTRAYYTHVGIAFWLRTGNRDRVMMVEAQGGTQRRIVNLSYYQNDPFDVVTPPKPWEEVSDRAIERLHQVPYGWFEAGYVGIREFLLKYFDKKIPYKDLPGEICSEFVAKVYGLQYTHVSPQLLLEQLLNKGQKIRMRVRGVGHPPHS